MFKIFVENGGKLVENLILGVEEWKIVDDFFGNIFFGNSNSDKLQDFGEYVFLGCVYFF